MKNDSNENITSSLNEIKEELVQLNKILGKIEFQIGFVGKRTPTIGEDPVVQQLRRIAEFLLHGSADGMYTYDTEEDRTKHLQYEKLRIELKEMKENLRRSKRKSIPKYYPDIPALLLQNELIRDFPSDSLENKLLKVILKDTESMKKEWSWDEIVEEWGESTENIDNKVVYRAGKRVNEKVAKKTDVKKFLIVKTKTIQVNPSLVT
ncbi:hypothetical protein JW796_02685 [Candidatus Dojkabacteria bacterium]|nr:hypothetical protein [Candidatus Dojkabacteria bacterium]